MCILHSPLGRSYLNCKCQIKRERFVLGSRSGKPTGGKYLNVKVSSRNGLSKAGKSDGLLVGVNCNIHNVLAKQHVPR